METFAYANENPWVKIVIIVLVAFGVQYIIHRYIGQIIRRVVKSHKYESKKVERQREDTLIGMLRTFSSVVIWVIALLMVLTALNVNIAALVTGAGLIGVVVGFGAQSTIKDILAGLFIIAENQYRVGDIIAIKDKAGVVQDITIRVTRLRDLDGYLHIIPNGQIETVTNMTFDYANVNIDLGVSYDTDIEKAKQIINRVGQEMAHDKKFQDLIMEPIAFLRLDHFDDSAVVLKVLGKVTPGSQWDVAGEFRGRIKQAFDAKDIEIPFPQRVIHTIGDAAD